MPKSKIYQQIRIFDNSPGVFFVKDIHGEQLFTLYRSKSFVSEDQAFINYQDTNLHELSYRSKASLLDINHAGICDFDDFTLISNITGKAELNNEEVANILHSYGFKKINFDPYRYLG